MEKFDVCVIGIGTIGSFASYYLSKANIKIAMIDLYAPSHDQGSYHGDTRIFRIDYGEGEKYIPMLKRAFDLWGEFESETNTKMFERIGVINIGHKDSEFMINTLSSAKDYNLDCEIIDRKEIEKRYSFFVPEDFLGVYERNTGYVYSDNSVITASNEAVKFGAKTFYGSEIKNIKKINDSYIIISKEYEFETKKNSSISRNLLR
ncbi:FAD-dependent oxidoreductase [Brachyspira hampsonii]|nr:FAD-dependent oxidoreductase [Brachyspira hampsonii]